MRGQVGVVDKGKHWSQLVWGRTTPPLVTVPAVGGAVLSASPGSAEHTSWVNAFTRLRKLQPDQTVNRTQTATTASLAVTETWEVSSGSSLLSRPVGSQHVGHNPSVAANQIS